MNKYAVLLSRCGCHHASVKGGLMPTLERSWGDLRIEPEARLGLEVARKAQRRVGGHEYLGWS